MRVIFFGTPPFAADIFKQLITNQVEICAVVTRPDRPRGRSGKPHFSALKQLITDQSLDIPLHQPERTSAPLFAQELSRYNADLFVVVAYGEIIKKEILDLPRLGCINLHPSLLSHYRGAAPIHFALLNDERETGVTIIEMVEKMDAGPILSQEAVSIEESDYFPELEKKLCVAGARQLLTVIGQYERGTVKKTAQNEAMVTFARKVNPDLAKIDWLEPARVIYNRVRAFTPRPGAWCRISIEGIAKRMKIVRARLTTGQGEAGETLTYSNQGWEIACGNGAIELLDIQLEGKKRLSIAEFICGVQKPPLLI